MRTPYALLLAALPSLALGQITIQESSVLAGGGRNDGIVNLKECNGAINDDLVLTWSALAAGTSTRRLKLWASKTANCPDGSSFALLADAPPDTNTASGAVRTAITNTGLDACVGETRLHFCAFLYDGTTVVSGISALGSMVVDGVTPSAPGRPSVTAGDGALNVSWGEVASAATYQVSATPPAGSDIVGTETSSFSQRLSGLTNNVTYQVKLQAFSQGGNPSGFSATTEGTPLEVDDFWKRYQRDGGAEQGGCGGSGGLLALLALLPLALRRRSP